MSSSNPFDLISNELGIAQGIPRAYTNAGFPNAAAAAAAAAALRSGVASSAAASNGGGGSGGRSKGSARSGSGSNVSSNKAGAGSGGGGGDDKVERRRKREREAARRSRRRKQQRMESLDRRVENLEAENKRLKEQIKWADIDALAKERDDLITKLQRILDSGDDEGVGELISAFNNVTEQIVDVNAKGATNIAASLDNSHLVNVILWMFISAKKNAGADKFETLDEDANPKESEDDSQEIIRKIGSKMNDKIREDVGLDESQYNAILEARGKYFDAFKAAYDQNQQALALVQELEEKRASMAHYVNVTKSFREHVLQKVLSEHQQAKLLVWLHRHKNLLRHLFSSSPHTTQAA